MLDNQTMCICGANVHFTTIGHFSQRYDLELLKFDIFYMIIIKERHKKISEWHPCAIMKLTVWINTYDLAPFLVVRMGRFLHVRCYVQHMYVVAMSWYVHLSVMI